MKMIKKDDRNMVPARDGPVGLFDSIDRTFEQLRNEIDSLFLGYPAYYPAESEMPSVRTPVIDMMDRGDSIVIAAEMPGIPKENIEIQVDENGIEIGGKYMEEKEDEKGNYYRKERFESSFYRYIPLPEEVKVEDVRATMNNGVLEIVLPKKSPVRKSGARKVNVE